jgi:plasmid maintenance system antidote protein VapI
MTFQDLHELLRLELLRRIEHGRLSGTSLARQAGFRQAHISNFLNRKRAISLEGLDRVLAAQNLSVEQIMPLELNAAMSSPATDLMEAIPVVSPSTAMDEARVRPGAVIETIYLSASQLQDSRRQPSPKSAYWQRFLAVRADEQQAAAMGPILHAGSIIVLDRHYTSLAPYRAHQRTLLAVRSGAGLVFRYVEFDDGRLILRPLSHTYPIQLLTLRSRQTPADYIVGRISLVISEL